MRDRPVRHGKYVGRLQQTEDFGEQRVLLGHMVDFARTAGRIVDDLWVEIYAVRELQYQKLMERVKVVPRSFIKLDRRTASPSAYF